MDKFERQIGDLLEEAGAEVIRSKRHIIYRLQDGRNFVQSSTPSTNNWSRRSLGDLRRLVGKPISSVPVQCAEPQAIPRMAAPTRIRTANLEARVDPGILIRQAKPSTGNMILQPAQAVPFTCLSDLLDVLYESSAYWRLNHAGRARVLMKFASQFAWTEAVPVRFCRLNTEERGLPSADKHRVLWARMNAMWRDMCSVAIRIKDPVGGDLIVEASSLRIMEGYEQFYITETEYDDFMAMSIRPVWDAEKIGRSVYDLNGLPEDRCILYEFLRPDQARKHSMAYLNNASWSDPARTRSAIREIVDLKILLQGVDPTLLSPGAICHPVS